MVTTLLAVDLLNRQFALPPERQTTPAIERETEYFRENIGEIETPEELLKDFRLYRYVLSAYDLTAALPGKALVQKVLEQGSDDDTDLANRLTDKKYKELTDDMGFAVAGNLKLQLPNFIDEVAARYQRVQLEDNAGETNPAVQQAAYFDRRLDDINSWFELLADRQLTEVAFTALGLPDAMKGMDIDRLKDELEERISFADLKAPETRTDFIRRFAVLSDLGGTQSSAPGSGALQIVSSAAAFGAQRAQGFQF